ncbi:MAG: cell division protein ZapA [Gammaproteobacteria bacterium]|nr:cell division protein ZapA [Gammaproteobacteria bacterium]|tara:strand:+ start:2118 stop:2432 length:315 start_codon:yes stop_codon:yes gene_type:complete
MAEETTTISVKILDKEYQVACPADEVDALTSSARYLDGQMNEIRESGKVFGLDRIAVMAALNIANEFINSRDSLASSTDQQVGRLTALSERISQALNEHKQLNL